MKILMVTPMPPRASAPGAIPLVLDAELTALAHRHEVTLVTGVGPDPAEQEAVDRLRAAGQTVYSAQLMQSSGRQRWRRRWHLASRWMGGRYPWRTLWFWAPEIQAILDTLLREQQFDLVIAEDNATGVYRFQTEAVLVLTEHEVRRPRPVDWFGWTTLQFRQWPRWLLSELDWLRWPQYQRRAWSQFGLIQVFTAEDAEAVRRLTPQLADRVRINPFGITLPPPADPEQEDPRALLFVGNFTHPPNVDAALWLGREIMPRLRQRCPGARLSIIGINPPAELRALACADILVIGPVPEIEPHLERAAVVLAPIRIGGGMRMKVLQALAWGKAVVATPRAAAGLARAGESLPLMSAGTEDETVEAVAGLLADPAARRRLGREARAFVAAHYTAEAYVSNLEASYANWLSRSQSLHPAPNP